MAEKINYGESQAQLAQRGVGAYTTAAQNNLANVKAELDKVAGELAAGIQVGMTPEETAALNARLNNLKNQAQTITGQVQASYDFATKQSQTSQQEYNQQVLAMQEAQRRLTAQTLSQLQSVPTPGGYSSSQAESAENIRRQAAAEQAFMTGRASVPADMQRIIPGLSEESTATQGGIIGVTGGSQKLFESALSSAQQSALANLATSQLRIQQELESEARTAASERETKQRDKYENFKISAINSIVGLTSEIGSKTAELEAAAASADTRSGRQVAMAELDAYKKKTAIDLSNDLSRIRAQASSAGLSKKEVADIDMSNKVALGSATNLSAFVQNRIKTLTTTPRLTAEGLIAKPGEAGFIMDKNGKELTYTGTDRFFLDTAGFLYYQENKNPDIKTGKASKFNNIDVNELNRRIAYGLGSAALYKNAKERNEVISSWYNDDLNGLRDNDLRKAAGVILGKEAAISPSFWQKSFTEQLTYGGSKNVLTLPTLPTLPPVQSKASIKLQEPIQPKGKLAKFTPAEKKRMAALLKPGVSISARK
jgi:hypothetical protein